MEDITKKMIKLFMSQNKMGGGNVSFNPGAINQQTIESASIQFYNFDMSKTYIYTYTKPTLEVFDVKVSKDILTEEAWGFIVTINSQTLYDYNYRYKMDVYVDGNNVGDSPCDKVSEGVVQFPCIYTGPVSNIQIIINYVSNLIFKGPLHIPTTTAGYNELTGVDLIKGERYRFYFRFVASGTVSIPSGNPEGLTSIVKLLSASSNQNELVRISSSSGKLMCQIRVDYYNNKWNILLSTASASQFYSQIILEDIIKL